MGLFRCGVMAYQMIQIIVNLRCIYLIYFANLASRFRRIEWAAGVMEEEIAIVT
jgi:hypothetical protein